VFLGLAHNLREHGSLTAPADPHWLLMSPADTAARDGFVPVADFAPLYPAFGAVTSDPVDGFTVAAVLAVFVAIASIGSLAREATGSTVVAALVQGVIIFGPRATRGLQQITTLDWSTLIAADFVALAFILAGLAVVVVGLRRARRPGDSSKSNDLDASAPRDGSPTPHRSLVVSVCASILLTGACLTRYAYLGAAAGMAVVVCLVWRRTRSSSDRALAVGCIAPLIITPLWAVGYQIATRSGAARSFTSTPAALLR
jgi:hypothetical protein